LTPLDKQYLKFADDYETTFLTQSMENRRAFEESLKIAWDVLSLLPASELIKIKRKYIDLYHVKKVQEA
jgi:V/A-type H+-transporting ATPase subunit B